MTTLLFNCIRKLKREKFSYSSRGLSESESNFSFSYSDCRSDSISLHHPEFQDNNANDQCLNRAKRKGNNNGSISDIQADILTETENPKNEEQQQENDTSVEEKEETPNSPQQNNGTPSAAESPAESPAETPSSGVDEEQTSNEPETSQVEKEEISSSIIEDLSDKENDEKIAEEKNQSESLQEKEPQHPYEINEDFFPEELKSEKRVNKAAEKSPNVINQAQDQQGGPRKVDSKANNDQPVLVDRYDSKEVESKYLTSTPEILAFGEPAAEQNTVAASIPPEDVSEQNTFPKDCQMDFADAQVEVQVDDDYSVAQSVVPPTQPAMSLMMKNNQIEKKRCQYRAFKRLRCIPNASNYQTSIRTGKAALVVSVPTSSLDYTKIQSRNAVVANLIVEKVLYG